MSSRGRRTTSNRRRTSNAPRRQTSGARRGRRKSAAESKAEMITWFLLVAIFGIIYILPEGTAVPNWLVPGLGGAVLVLSGVYQYVRGWRVSPITWMVGMAMIALALWGFNYSPRTDLIGPSLLAFAVVIGAGVITGET